MSNKIGIGSNFSILRLYNMMRDGDLILHPDFQRRLVWNDQHKESFLETIIMGYPFPEIYLADGELDLDNLTAKKLVVDGQQRLSTIKQYIEDDDQLVLKRIPRFKDLTNQEDFVYYDVVVRDLKNTPMDKIKEIFRRINSVSYALNAMEINNALYEGAFIKTAQDIVDNEAISQMGIFDKNAVSRMKDTEFVLLIMSTVELGTYFANTQKVEEFIQRYDNNYPNSDRIKKDFIKIIEYIISLCLNLDSIWRSRNGFFTLICELFFYYYRTKTLPDNTITKQALDLIETETKKSNPEEKYADFYSFLYQNTSSKKARTTRGVLLRDTLSSLSN